MLNPAVLLVMLIAASCSPASSSLCVAAKPYPNHVGAPTMESQYATVDACLQQWARKLAPGPDALDEVADAVAAACDGTVLVQAHVFAADAKRTDGLAVAPEPDNAGFRADARRVALVLVAQARAGKCPVT